MLKRYCGIDPYEAEHVLPASLVDIYLAEIARDRREELERLTVLARASACGWR